MEAGWVGGGGGWAQGWMMSGCRAACPPVWLQREAPGAGRRVGKSDASEGERAAAQAGHGSWLQVVVAGAPVTLPAG